MRTFVFVLSLAFIAGCNDSNSNKQNQAIGTPCTTSGQCGTGKFFCDTTHANGYCKASCASDANCPQGSICVASACERACVADADCRAGDLCLAPGYCDQPPVVDLGGSD